MLLQATHGSALAYSLATSRQGAVTIVDGDESGGGRPITLAVLTDANAQPAPAAAAAAAAAEATVLALGPHVVARGGGTRIVFKLWRQPHHQPHQPPNPQWTVDYKDEVRAPYDGLHHPTDSHWLIDAPHARSWTPASVRATRRCSWRGPVWCSIPLGPRARRGRRKRRQACGKASTGAHGAVGSAPWP